MKTETLNTSHELEFRGVRVIAALNGLELFGHERGNIEAFKALRSMGAVVRIGVNERDDGGEVGQHLRDLGFEVFSIPFGPQWSWQWLKKLGPKFAIDQFQLVMKSSRIFTKEIKAFHPTHIHIGSTLVYSFLCLALRKCSVPVIWRMGDCPPTDSRFNYGIWKLGMRRIQRVVAISHFVETSAITCGVSSEKISQIYNLAPSTELSVSTGTPPIDSDASSYTSILYVGAISHQKGLSYLIKAFGSLVKENPNLRLWILGGSQWDSDFHRVLNEEIVRLEIEQFVHFKGYVLDTSPWYSSVALHIAPSICNEALGNVVMEAKRAGTPSIVFPSGGLPEMIRHRIDGYVCEDKTADNLAAAVRWMLSDRDRLNVMGVNACEDSETRFGPDRFSREWAAVYRNTTTLKQK
jgi:glycosyltransferase involved in cell wall biosynthesis